MNSTSLLPKANLEAAIERFSTMKLCTVGEEGDRHERPNKAIALLVALDLMDEGRATPAQIPWNADFRVRFSRYFAKVKRSEDIDSVETQFLNLRNDGIWQAYRIVNGEMELCETHPTPKDDGTVFASFTNGLEALTKDRETRETLREKLIERYFPGKL